MVCAETNIAVMSSRFITSGHNTGTNFMLYPGSPDLYHALCTVYIANYKDDKDRIFWMLCVDFKIAHYEDYSSQLKSDCHSLLKTSAKDKSMIEDCTVEPVSSFEGGIHSILLSFTVVELQSSTFHSELGPSSSNSSSLNNLFLQRVIRISESIHKPLLLIYASKLSIDLNESNEHWIQCLNQYSYLSTFIEV